VAVNCRGRCGGSAPAEGVAEALPLERDGAGAKGETSPYSIIYWCNENVRTDLNWESYFMRKFVVLLCLATATALAEKIQVPPVTRDTLENGLTVLLMQYKKVPVVHLRLVVFGGSALDPDSLPGVASMTAAIMREGTETRTSTEISEAIDFVGGSLSVSAGQDYCAANAQVLKKDLEIGLNLFSDIIRNPVFPDEEINREREQRLAQLDALKEEASTIASMVFSKKVYATHPYGRQTSGTRASLAFMIRDDLVEFHRSGFVPNNAILAVVGDFEQVEMLQSIKIHFADWQRGSRQNHRLAKPSIASGRNVVLVKKPDATQTQIRIGNTGIDIRNPDRFALEVAITVFGGGFTSRLAEEVRVKRSLTYGISSRFPSNLFGGTFVIGTFTKNETVSETIDVVLDELKKFREKGMTKDELQKAQNYIAGDFARDLQTPEALASQITDIELYAFPKNYLETYIQIIRNIRLEDVQRVIRTYFHLDDLVFVLVGPGEVVRPQAEKYGKVGMMELDEVVE